MVRVGICEILDWILVVRERIERLLGKEVESEKEMNANREFNRLQLLGKQVKNSVLRILRLLLLRRMK